MTARNKTNRKSKSSLVRKRRQSSKQSNTLNFEMLERRELLAAITVGNASNILSQAADTSSIAALIANDGGDGVSLREAVTAANNTAGEDTITFDASVFTGGDNNLIRLTQGELLISDSLNIDGSSVGGVLITGDANGDDVTVTSTNVTDVEASFGGVVGAADDLLKDNNRVLGFSGSGDLTLKSLTITGGRETVAGGGGIRFTSSGSFSLDRSTISGNSSARGGGIFIYNGVASLTNSTVSGNTSNRGNGGGIYLSDGDLSLTNSTVTDNNGASFARGGGIAVNANVPGLSSLTLHNSIVAGNTARQSSFGPDLFVFGDVTTDDLNVENSLIGVTEGSMVTASTGTGNILDQRPLLTPLANNGGGTLTHGLLQGSPAIDAGSNALAVDASGNPLTIDQRGESRILGTVDIGSLELGTEADFETQSLVVNITQDVADPNDGLTSLREAIIFANDSTVGVNNDGDADGDGSALDTITFDPSVFTGGDNNLIRLTQGELLISESLNIDGSSVGGVVITGDANDDDITVAGTDITDVSASYGGTAGASDDLLNDNSRVLDFLTSGNLTLTDLTITGGRAMDGSVGYGFQYSNAGGGIRAYNSGYISLFDSSVSGNSTMGDRGSGGGIFTRLGDDDDSGRVSLTNSTVSGNSTGRDGNGGGIFSDFVTLTNSIVTGNRSGESNTRSDGSGGGIFASSDVVLVDSAVSGNSSGNRGGGISATNASLTNSVVSGNVADDRGGGISTGNLSSTNSVVNGNISRDRAGGIYIGGGVASLTNSTVSENSAQTFGGGIFASAAEIYLTNSTVDGNSSLFDGGGIFSSRDEVSLTNSTLSGNSSGRNGGAIGTYRSSILLVNSTVTGNSAASMGGGIRFDDSNGEESLTLYNSIVASNRDDGTAPDIFASLAATNVANSLIGDTTGFGIIATTGIGNILDQLPLLGPLADNGGPTQTHALLAGSPAIDAGSNAFVDAAAVTTDQRGEARIEFGTVDIGAVEVGVETRLIVTTNLDVDDQTDGLTSLREAIALANSDVAFDTIAFDPSVFDVETTIAIASQLPTITDALTITGPGANLLTIDAQGGGDNVLNNKGFRIVEVSDGDSSNSIDVTISGLTLTGGDNSGSGGAINNFENLTLDGVAIVDNRARFGGGISNELSGVLSLSNSTIANNRASQDGGGISTRGAVTATNSTISGNSATGNGAAIVTAGDSSGVTLDLTQVTLTNNAGNDGVYFNGVAGPTIATFNNSIIDNPVTGAGRNGTTLTGGYNLFASADPGITGAGNLFNQTSLLGPLADNGGPTPTHALLLGSPAYNAGSTALALDENGSLLTTDQRGERRNQFISVDIGAVESEFDTVRSLIVTTSLDVNDPLDGLTSLREAIAFAVDPNAGANSSGDLDGDGLIEDTITFDASVFTGGDNSVIRLTQGELFVNASLRIEGASVGGVVITGDANDDDVTLPGTNITDVSASFGGTVGAADDLLDDNSRVLNFSASSGDLTLTGLTITGGNTAVNYSNGGGIQFGSGNQNFIGTLTLNQSIVSGNSVMGSSADGGGIHARNDSAVFLIDSTVSGNYSNRRGGGISSDGDGGLSLTNSTVSENSSGVSGGGISSGNSADISLHNSTVNGNNSGGPGGGISVSSAADVILTDSSVSGNTSDGGGGGIFSNRGDVLLDDSAVSGNVSGSAGGGIYSEEGNVSLSNSAVNRNASDFSGGGIYSRDADVLLTGSTVNGNSTANTGGGLYSRTGDLSAISSTVSGNVSAGSGGGIRTSSGDVSLTNSTLSGNSTTNAGSDGGGLYSRGGDLTFISSTLSGNVSAGSGGGFRTRDGDVLLTNSTISGNSAGNSGGGILSGDGLSNNSTVLLINSTVTANSASEGGGIAFNARVNSSAQPLTLRNSIVAGNNDNGTAPDLMLIGGDASDLLVENSLIGDITGSRITFAIEDGNVLNQLPLLGPLAENGGPTLTHALLSGSPAINGGSNAIASAAELTADQRGVDRIQVGTVDIGAFESDLRERTLVVTTDQDVVDPNDGVLSLREAIISSNEGLTNDTITFEPAVFNVKKTINVSSQLAITDAVTITGLGANLLTIDALGGGDDVLDGNGFRIFEVNDGDSSNSVAVSISGLMLAGGDTGDSGGAISNFENLTLDGVAIAGNRARFGGGVSNDLTGRLTITNSTIADNEASEDGGGVSTGGDFTATNITISGNNAVGSGGAIFSAGAFFGATLNLTQSTLANNTGSDGVHLDNVGVFTTATFNNTIIDDSITGVGINGTLLAGNNNLFATADPGISGTDNLFSQSPLLRPLTDNGGPTLTHALEFDSPAIDAGSNALAVNTNGAPLLTDQRGDDRIRFGTVDIGAFETAFIEEKSLFVTTNQDVVNPGDELISLREAIAFANTGLSGGGDADGDGLGADTITFDASVFTGGDNSVIRLTQGELLISDSLMIDGSFVGGVVITGDADGDDIILVGTDITDVSASFGGTTGSPENLLDDNSRVLNFSAASDDLTLTGLTITGGRVTSDFENGGGVRFSSSGTFMLNQSTVAGNSVTGSFANGGGIFSDTGDIFLIDSIVSENSGRGVGGGIFNSSGNVSLDNSTVSGNSTSGSLSRTGGIYTNSGDISLNNSSVSGNVSSGGDGGGIRTNSGQVSLNNSTVSENSTTGQRDNGGGILTSIGDVSLINSTVSGNSTAGIGGGIFTALGDVSLSNSTVSGNVSSSFGGGIRTDSGDVFLSNSTLSGNVSGADGGGIFAENSTISVVNSTVTGNTAAGVGGGIGLSVNGANGRLTISNSIVAGNLDSGTAPDVEAAGSVISDLALENSLIGDTGGSGITGSTGTGNILNQSALLSPLAENGGPTLTHALLPGSPAIGAGSNALAVDENGIPLSTDQTGQSRFVETVDIGAVESEFDDPFLLSDTNLDGEIDFDDIAPLINSLANNSFLNEADINRDGEVTFDDISLFIPSLAAGRSAQFSSGLTAPVISSEAVVSSEANVAEPPVSSLVSEVTSFTPESFASVNFMDGTVAILETSLSQLINAEHLTSPVSQDPIAVTSLPTGATRTDTNVGPVAASPANYSFEGTYYSSFRGIESNDSRLTRRSLSRNTSKPAFLQESRDILSSTQISTEGSFSSAAELFDASPESLDEIFNFESEKAFATLIE